MKFEKVTIKDKDGKDVEVLRSTQDSTSSLVRNTSVEEQEKLLDGLKALKAREMTRWDNKIASQRQKVLDAAAAMGVTLDPARLDGPSDSSAPEVGSSAGGTSINTSGNSGQSSP